MEVHLSPLEHELVRSVEAGDVLDRYSADETMDAALDQWSEHRSISAAVVRQILLGRQARKPDPHGVQIRGVRITGELDLANVQSQVELRLMTCDIPDGVNMRGARLTGLTFSGCRVGVGTALGGASLDANGLTASFLLLDVDRATGRRFTASGAVWLSGVHISGQLHLSGAQLQGQDRNGYTLVADGIQVGGAALMRVDQQRPFTAAGAVRLIGAHISGQLDLSGAQLGRDKKGDALIADGMQVGNAAFLRVGQGRPFTAAGAVRLIGAHISGQLNLSGAQLQGQDRNGDALVAAGMHVAGAAFLRVGDGQPFTAAGGVLLSDARVTGQLDLSGAQLQGPDNDGYSLRADRVQVGGDAVLRGDTEQPFTAVGTVRLPGAQISGVLDMDDDQLRLRELDLGGATVGSFRLHPVSVERVMFAGLTYVGMPALGKVDDWLDVFRRRTTAYHPQPYQQLAAACRSAGHEHDARRVLIAQQDDRRNRVLRAPTLVGEVRPAKRLQLSWTRWQLWWRRFGLLLQKLALGYGYRARRAFYATVIVLGAASLIGWAAGHTHSSSTGHFAAYRPSPTSAQAAQRCSTVEQVALGLRPGLPFLSTVTAGECAFDTATTIGGSYALIDWSLQALAWAGAALAVAGYTGLVRKT